MTAASTALRIDAHHHVWRLDRGDYGWLTPALAPIYRDFRAGDVRHSLADISKAHRLLGYEPTHVIGDGLSQAMEWYLGHLSGKPQR